MKWRYRSFAFLPTLKGTWDIGRLQVYVSAGNYPLLPDVDNYNGPNHRCWQAWCLLCGYRIQWRKST